MRPEKKTYSLVVETKSLADLLQTSKLSGEVAANGSAAAWNEQQHQKRMIKIVLDIRRRYHDVQQQVYRSPGEALSAFRKASAGNLKDLFAMVLVSAYCHETGDFTDLKNTARPLRKEEG